MLVDYGGCCSRVHPSKTQFAFTRLAVLDVRPSRRQFAFIQRGGTLRSSVHLEQFFFFSFIQLGGILRSSEVAFIHLAGTRIAEQQWQQQKGEDQKEEMEKEEEEEAGRRNLLLHPDSGGSGNRAAGPAPSLLLLRLLWDQPLAHPHPLPPPLPLQHPPPDASHPVVTILTGRRCLQESRGRSFSREKPLQRYKLPHHAAPNG